MCGIAGYIGKKQVSKSTINKTLGLMKNRGPDNQDWCFFTANDTNVYLLHSRLSIIDLDERSNQPFKFGGCTLIFNGEIYNYIELRTELKKAGHIFTTDSDTEVLMKAYITYGIDCIKHFNGMWAFAIWDSRKEELFLSRDRFGEKPLYYFHDNDGIYFASEIKFIFLLLGKRLSINHHHLYRYLVNGYKSLNKSKENFFDGIQELSSGSYIILDSLVNKKEERYWHPSFEQNPALKYEDIVLSARELMEQTVKLRIRSDVPLAFCMSGGIDSNSLISIAKNLLDYDVHGFTIINQDKRYDEKENVEYAVKKQNLKHTEIPVNPHNFLPQLRELICYHDSPVYTLSYFSHWLIMKSIAEHGYRISISGTGADELFSGYFDHHLSYFAEIYKDEKLYEKSYNYWKKYTYPNIRNPHLKNPRLMIDNPEFRDHIFLNAETFSDYLCEDWFESFNEQNYCNNLMRNRMANEMFHEIIPIILHEDDLNAMYFSIENRSPFLDHNLFEFCQTIPTKYLIQKGYAKVVLRQAMDGIVPQQILNSHRKVGFNAPIFSFLDTNDDQVREYLLDDSPIFDHIRHDKIETLLSKQELPNSESKFLFNFVNSKIFIEEFS